MMYKVILMKFENEKHSQKTVNHIQVLKYVCPHKILYMHVQPKNGNDPNVHQLMKG